MRTYHVNSGAGIDGLSVREHEVPVPGPGEVLVALRAASLSFRELMVLRGDYVLPVKPDVIPVSDGAGEIVAVGPGVDPARIGDRVMATLFPSWQDGPFGPEHLPQLGGSLDGMLTEYAVLPESALVPVPTHLTFQEAATLPCVAVAAWNALTGDTGGGVRAGQTVVVQGSGGVSLFALQFAKMLGAHVIATTSSQEKAKRLLKLGADEVIDYRTTPDWPGRVRELTGGRGADRVIEVAGLLEESLKAVKVYGHVAFVGFVSDTATPLDPMVLFASGATVRPLAVGSRAQFLEMSRAIEVNRLRPVIDREFAFDDAPDAYRHLASGQTFGKVVITV
ncbi:zinc-dependent alcohol dehydrogenase family protein [Streptomyces sp. CBMA123]|uniref:zinc-dependent alcohol dehydrogenase family protein n=1 Tax=Streptomyces sp. CBMA123 TaxID=1896313 RepID=UPI0016619685|nr:NAD(P)-dependent alcohol dehydrogenase [Streptomyces sp. CBMA123]MBD0694111.1 NADPH:quinone oxidoreductase [Streptomyces sp. CBMA123]